jgi:hypothetical protein
MLKELFNAYAEEHAIDIQIGRLKKELLSLPANSTESMDCQGQIEDLIKLRDLDKESKIDLGKLLNAGVSLVSIAMILDYEKEDIITTKALGIATRLLGK